MWRGVSCMVCCVRLWFVFFPVIAGYIFSHVLRHPYRKLVSSLSLKLPHKQTLLGFSRFYFIGVPQCWMNTVSGKGNQALEVAAPPGPSHSEVR